MNVSEETINSGISESEEEVELSEFSSVKSFAKSSLFGAMTLVLDALVVAVTSGITSVKEGGLELVVLGGDLGLVGI